MILCEFGPEGRPALFRNPRALVLAHAPHEVAPALERLDAARRAGRWIAGWIAYEAGYALEDRLRPLMPPGPGPLLAFGLFDAPDEADFHMPPDEEVRLSPFEPRVSRGAYDAAFARVQSYIRAGDCYQVNLTFPLESRLERGSRWGLYRALRRLQPVGFAAYADLGGPVVVSRSPELFLRLDAGGRIETLPMVNDDGGALAGESRQSFHSGAPRRLPCRSLMSRPCSPRAILTSPMSRCDVWLGATMKFV